MTKYNDGNVYYTIGEVAELLGRTSLTIKRWYEWWENQDDTTKKLYPLPYIYRNLDSRGTRYMHEDDVKHLREFRDSIKYGTLADLNRKFWGKRKPS